MKSQKGRKGVTPAKAGVQKYSNFLDSRFRGNDEKGKSVTLYETIKIRNLKLDPRSGIGK